MIHLLFGTDGRIGRGRFWLGVLMLFIATMVVFAILAAFGLREVHTATSTVTTAVDNGAPGAPSTSESWTVTLVPWGSFLLTVLLAYPWAVLGIKRRHDRANRGWDVIAFIALSVLVTLLAALGQGQTTLAGILGVIEFLGGLWLFVVLGCLRGTAGPNTYGPDPIGPRA